MAGTYLEIVELPDGEIALQSVEDGQTLVTIKFSEEAKTFLQDAHVEVAHVMLNAGINVVGSMAEQAEKASKVEDENRIFH